MNRSELSAERARELFNYDPATGSLTWKQQNSSRAAAGCKAGCMRSDGYLLVGVDKSQYLAHRVIWLLQTGVWPTYLVDHVNGVRSDNSWVNLRKADQRLNQENQKQAKASSTSGLLGVSPSGHKWRSRIVARGTEVHLGTFATPEEAHQAYLTAKRQLHAGCTI